MSDCDKNQSILFSEIHGLSLWEKSGLGRSSTENTRGASDKKGIMTGPFLRKSILSDRLRRENGVIYSGAFSAFKAENAFLFSGAPWGRRPGQSLGGILVMGIGQ